MPAPSRAVDSMPEGKDIEVSWTNKRTPNSLSIHYTVRSLSNSQIWVLDRPWTGSANKVSLDSEGAYRFERNGELRLLLGAAPLPRRSPVLLRVMPYVRPLPAHGVLEGDLSMPVPVPEYSVYFAQPRTGVDPSAVKATHTERVTLLVQYIVAGPTLKAEALRDFPGVLKLPAFALAEAKVAHSTVSLPLDVLRRTGDFDRVTMPGEADEPL